MLKPEYNILQVARSSLGLKHSIDTINKLKERFKKENHPKYGSKTSIETRYAISAGIKEFYKNNTHKFKGKKGKLSPQYGIGGLFVFCYKTSNVLKNPTFTTNTSLFGFFPNYAPHGATLLTVGPLLRVARGGEDKEKIIDPQILQGNGVRLRKETVLTEGRQGAINTELIFPSINAARQHFKVR
jgi:hypothetical protein